MADFYMKTCFVIKGLRNSEYVWLHQETQRLEDEGKDTGWVIRPEVTDIIGEPPHIEDIIGDVYFTVDEAVHLENLGEMLVEFLAQFRPDEMVVFSWAYLPSRPLAGAYGGGAMAVTSKKFDIHTTDMWLRLVEVEEEWERVARDCGLYGGMPFNKSKRESAFPITVDLCRGDGKECCCSCAPSPEDLSMYLKSNLD